MSLAWMAGEQTEPVQRWAIYEIIPFEALLRGCKTAGDVEQALALQACYAGPSPVSQRRWVMYKGHLRHISESPISQQQWELGRAHQAHANLFWILQGEAGGHPYRLDPLLTRLYRLTRGRDYAPKAPGDLPYAVWDRRVEAKLGQYLELREAGRRLRRREDRDRTAADARAERRAREIELAHATLAWLDREVAQQLQGTERMYNVSDLPEGTPITDEAMHQATQEFVEGFVQTPKE